MINELKIKQNKERVKEAVNDKYDCPGLYSISIGDKLVYIGKSKSIIDRIGFHIWDIEDEEAESYNSHKYEIMREAIRRGKRISFELIYKSEETDEDKIEEDIGYQEGVYIRKYLPPLNYQIPKEDNWRKFSVNKKAKTIKLDELLVD